MSSTFISALGNHLWQSSVIAALAGLLTLMLRKHGAHVRYWVWFTASVKFLVPLSILIRLGSVVKLPFPRPITAPYSVAIVATEIAQPFIISTPAPLRPSPVGTMRQYEPKLLLITWLVGFLTIVALWGRSWWRMRAIIRGASPAVISPSIHAMASPVLLEPSVFGIFRPVLLVPHDIQERLSEEQLHSVVAHEMCHIRRRDNLLSSVHMAVVAIFWFYPVVWWLGARLLEERERVCDEQVVRQGSDPHAYAEGILQVCKSYLESPLRCASGVSGANLQRRIEGIVSGRAVHKLNFGRIFLLTVSAIAALVIPFAVGMVKAFPQSHAITRPADTPKWEAVSVKPCGADLAGLGARGGGPPIFSPGRMVLTCQNVHGYILISYILNANGRANPIWVAGETPIEGGPSWIKSEQYTINAKAEGTPGKSVMEGPMLQALLEDRFKLKVHRETREIPMYALTVGKNGPKLQPFQEGTCTPTDPTRGPGDAPLPSGTKRCPVNGRKRGPNSTVDAQGITVEMFSGLFLGLALDHRVVNKTGIAGLFDFHLEYADPTLAAGASTQSDIPVGPSIFTAVEQLGLKLELTKGRGEYLVIDSVERPTEN